MNNQQDELQPISYSLEADMATGWKPKLKIIGPMPLNFDNPTVDKSLMALISQESAFYQVSYLGPRPVSSFKMQELLAKQYRYKYGYLLHNDFAHLKPFFQKFYSLFQPEIKRPFHGMNPNLRKHELVFDSCFQGGNLDCAVRLKMNEYDLLMRVDSNSVGHIQWFYFRVANTEDEEKTIRFNLANLRKNKSAYERGMRPYVKRHGREWQQQGNNIEVTHQQLRYHKQNLIASMMEENNLEFNFFRKIGFQLTFQPHEEIYVAYGIPYSYSKLLDDIKYFRKKAKQKPEISFEVNLQNQSLSGLQIPVIKIRSGAPSNGKYCVFMIARQHPGESNGSHVLKGSIEQLLSGSAISMKVLSWCDFVIIPMLNPDGVVAGNFRTSLFGRDLNRLWKTKDSTLIPEVEMARTVFGELVETYKKKILLFMDYHGHSTRKNAFLLGPGIFDAQLMNDIRILPRIMANYTEIFRYPSCSFRLDQNRKTTARALFGKFAGLSYTIQTSNWAYYSHATKSVFEMTVEHFEGLGVALFRSMQEFLLGKIEQKNKYLLRSQEEESRKLKIFKTKGELKMRKSITFRDSESKSKIKTKQIRTKTQSMVPSPQNQQNNQSLINENRQPVQIKEANSSDEMSDNGMDSDGSEEDMDEQKFKKYMKNVSDILVEFQRIYYGDNYKKGMSKYKLGNSKSSNKLLMKKDKKKKEEFVQPCFKQFQKKTESHFSTIDHHKNRGKDFLFSESLVRDSLEKNRVERKKAESQMDRNRFERKKVQSEFQKNILERKKAESDVQKFRFQRKKAQNDAKREEVRIHFQQMKKDQARASGMTFEQIGLSSEINKIQKFEILNFDKGHVYKKQERSPDKVNHSPKNTNIHLIINKSKELNTLKHLPEIKGSKHALEEELTSSKKVIPKTKETFNDLLMSEQILNKNHVINVLKLSRLQQKK